MPLPITTVTLVMAAIITGYGGPIAVTVAVGLCVVAMLNEFARMLVARNTVTPSAPQRQRTPIVSYDRYEGED